MRPATEPPGSLWMASGSLKSKDSKGLIRFAAVARVARREPASRTARAQQGCTPQCVRRFTSAPSMLSFSIAASISASCGSRCQSELSLLNSSLCSSTSRFTMKLTTTLSPPGIATPRPKHTLARVSNVEERPPEASWAFRMKPTAAQFGRILNTSGRVLSMTGPSGSPRTPQSTEMGQSGMPTRTTVFRRLRPPWLRTNLATRYGAVCSWNAFFTAMFVDMGSPMHFCCMAEPTSFSTRQKMVATRTATVSWE
mmetsp:Transcript_38735/g.109538  ORF Transcript_38735/g.109538 Transcript_38735/m.109538 type:complete len:254 (+) Transcript_38735:154-915(+)